VTLVSQQPCKLETGARSLSISQTLKALHAGKLGAIECTTRALERAERSIDDVKAFSVLNRDGAIAAARESEKHYRNGTARALEGVPIAIKDIINTANLETRYGSTAHISHIPKEDAEIVRQLRNAGAIIIGKTTTHEFAWGVTTSSPVFGDTLNPHNIAHIPGGSSGGAAAAIAYGAVAAGLGTDTGGSVRIPASLCGVFGFKPSYKRLSTRGIFPLSRRFDHPGILGATLEDVAMLAQVFGLAATIGEKSPRVGIIEAIAPIPTDGVVSTAFAAAVKNIEREFHTQTFNDLPIFDGLFAAFADTVLIEAGLEHLGRHSMAFIDAHYTTQTASRIRLAQDKSVGDYVSAMERTRRFKSDLAKLFENVDYLLLPTCPCVAPKLGDKAIAIGDWAGNEREALMAYTAPFNLSGLPAISIPMAVPKGTLPAGIQLVGKPGRDGELLKFAQKLFAVI